MDNIDVRLSTNNGIHENCIINGFMPRARARKHAQIHKPCYFILISIILIYYRFLLLNIL